MIRNLVASVPLFLALLASPSASAAINVSPVNGISLAVSSQVTPVPLNQMHSWVISLHNATGSAIENATITIDGGMPQHDHGLATKPQVTDYLGDGNYLIEGIRFHMPGAWLMQIQIEYNGQRYHSEASLQL